MHCNRRSGRSIVPAVLLLCLLIASPASAQWREGGTFVTQTRATDYKSVACSDGAGGIITAWLRGQGGSTRVMAQRTDDRGRPRWGAEGVVVFGQSAPKPMDVRIAADAVGGAWLAWHDEDLVTGAQSVRIQHLDAQGVAGLVDGGEVVSAADISERGTPELAVADDGHVMVVWSEMDAGVWNLYGVRWSTGGFLWGQRVLAQHQYDQQVEKVVSLRDGEVGVVWTDDRAAQPGIYVDIYNVYGSSMLGYSYGKPLAAVSFEPSYVDAVHDGEGGMHIGWIDHRVGAPTVWFNRLTASGAVLGEAGGIEVCGGTQWKGGIAVVRGVDGLWVGWGDSSTGQTQLTVQRYDTDLEARLPAGGVPVGGLPQGQFYPRLLADGKGGIFALWQQNRSLDGYDIWAQRVAADGSLPWGAGGVAVAELYGNAFVGGMASDGADGILAAWTDNGWGGSDMLVQRIGARGHWGYPAPTVVAVRDVPGDQGGRVLVQWDPSRLDAVEGPVVDRYTVWRALAGAAAPSAKAVARGQAWQQAAVAGDGPVMRAAATAGGTVYWELIQTLDAYQRDGYAATVATLCDSTGTASADHSFQVLAHDVDGGCWWESLPVTGRSVDNLAPAAPSRLVGEGSFDGLGLALRWTPDGCEDLRRHRVYKGWSEGFAVGEASLVAVTADTTWTDAGWSMAEGAWYKVAGEDVHGNVGEVAVLAPTTVTGVDDGASAGRTALLGNHPNPFNPRTTIRFALAEAGRVRVSVYDVAGRLVARVVDREMPAGTHDVVWDGRDGAGRGVASGVYPYVFEAGAARQRGRMVVVR